uniref:Uncharacterized protein n=1 Tax=Arundo donax TaxID=35708 RepID=A0A0A9BXB4_ARUDO
MTTSNYYQFTSDHGIDIILHRQLKNEIQGKEKV